MMFGLDGRREMTVRVQEQRLRQDGHGTVGDVHFDLRHPKLGGVEWEFRGPLSVAPDFHPGFFVTGDLDDEKELLIGGITVGEIRRAALAKARAKGCEVLRQGDRITVSDVTIMDMPDAGPFALLPDTQIAALALQAASADGTVTALKNTLTLFMKGSLRPWSGDESSAELRVLFGRLSYLSAEPGDFDQDVRDLISDGAQLQRDTDRLVKSLLTEDQPDATAGGLLTWAAPHFAAVELERLVSAAALYGYRQGRLEAERKMEPLARKKLEADEQAREAGATRRDWRRVDFAKEYWSNYPTASVYEVVRQFLLTPAGAGCTESSVNRSIKPFCPETSKSYSKITNRSGRRGDHRP